MERRGSRHLGLAALTFLSAPLALWAWFAFATAPYPWVGAGYSITGLLGLAMLAAVFVFYKATTDISLGVAGWAGLSAGFGALVLCVVGLMNVDGHGNYGYAAGARYLGLLGLALGLLPAPAAGLGVDGSTRAALWLAFACAVGYLIACAGNWMEGPFHIWTIIGDAVGTFAYAGFAVLLAALLVDRRLAWPKLGAFAYFE